MIDAIPLLLAPEGYQISRSVRLRSSASAYLNRTPASAGNRKTWTWSGWVKKAGLGVAQFLFAIDANNFIRLRATETFQITFGTTNVIETTALLRDPSAWYHLIIAIDTTQATSTDRIKMYVNGVQQSLTIAGGAYPTLNSDLAWNNNVSHLIGGGVASNYLDGYLTEINFIDGQALTPSSFGETNYITGVWQPKKYTGTYGTNGFYLNFSDNSSNTATTIGKDYSGNGNNWTPNNISVTAGVTYDSMLDVPTLWADGGNGRGNYGVINPLAAGSDATISNANLSVAYGTSATISTTLGTFGMSSGQWYWENTITATSIAAVTAYIGLVNQSNPTGAGAYPGATSRGWSYYGNLGNIYNNGGTIQTGVGTFAVNDVIGVAFDADAGTLRFYKNNTQVGTTITGVPSDTYYAAWSDGSQGNTFTIAANFGQRPFAYTPPTGFKALNTQNLPTPTILKGNQYFDVRTWSGDSATPKAVVTDLAFQPDLIWAKTRSTTYDHMLFDSVRGAGSTKDLSSNTTGAEGTNGALYGYVSSIDTAGFTVTKGSGATNILNQSGQTFVGWQWKEGPTQGFDIVTYTGNGTSQNIAHSLGVAPKMVIVKNRTTAGTGWAVQFSGATASNQYLNLQSTAAVTTSANAGWNNTLATSSVFSVGGSSWTNTNGDNYVAYLFAEVAGFSRFGSYTGNGSADGPFVFCGFRPKWVMIKNTSTAATDWMLYDSARDEFNLVDQVLYPNLSNAEATATSAVLDFVSNGFKLRGSGTNTNANGSTYIFAAFAENPFKNSLAR